MSIRASEPLTDAPVTGAPMGPRRRAVLERLRGAELGLAVDELAAQTGLHVNTARFHLDKLVESGHAARHAEGRDTPGRPRIRYVARPAAEDGPSSYRLLSRMLVGLVDSLDTDGTAVVEAGRAWGRHLVGPVTPMRRVGADEALARLDTLMDEVGFAPETTSGQDPEVRLHHCPFLEVAHTDPEVVCGLHRGLIEGALDRLGGPVRVQELEPFATPRTCVARLRRTDSTG